MIAGKPKDEIDKMIYAIREICPDVGIIRKNGRVILTGNGIERIIDIVKTLSEIEAIEPANKYGTQCILEMKSGEEVMMNAVGIGRGEELCIIV